MKSEAATERFDRLLKEKTPNKKKIMMLAKDGEADGRSCWIKVTLVIQARSTSRFQAFIKRDQATSFYHVYKP